MSGGTTAAVLVMELEPDHHASGSGEAQMLAAGLRLARRLVQAGGPIEVQVSGNGLAAAFADPDTAVTAAVALRSRFGPGRPRPATVRIGLSVGDVEAGPNGWFGLAYAEAAALCRVAGAGQVMVSPAAAELLASVGSAVLTPSPAGPYFLENEAGAESSSLPSGLAAALEGPLVGREEDLGSVLGAWRETLAGVPAAVFLGGEPGIGKSRLLAELARRVLADGALVLWGAADDDPGYGPVAVALGRLLEPALRGLVSDMEDDLALVGRLVPGLAGGEGTPAAPGADEMTRLRLFEAVASVLIRLASGRPVLLVLEDLHAAAPGTVALLRHLLRRADRHQLMVAVTYRSTELDRTHPLFALMADLTGAPGILRQSLLGLNRGELELLLGGRAADPGRLLELTGGNPLFALSVLDGLDPATGTVPDTALPTDVMEVLAARIGRLSKLGRTAVQLGAVAGPRFTLELLEGVASSETSLHVLDGLEEAAAAGLIRETDPGRYAFSHGLIHLVVQQTLTSDWKVQVHHRLASELTSSASQFLSQFRDPAGRLWLAGIGGANVSLLPPLPAGDDEAILAAARHWLAATEAGLEAADIDTAYLVVLTAGAILERRTAFEEQVRLAELAVGVLGPRLPAPDRIRLTIRLAEAVYNNDQVERCRELASAAADEAIAIDDAELLAAATFAYGQFAYAATPDPRSAELHHRAIAALTGRSDEIALRRLSSLKCSWAWQLLATEAQAERAEALAREALELALRLPDREAEMYNALMIQAISTVGTNRLDEREALVARATGLLPGQQRSEQVLALEATTHLERGDTAGFAARAHTLREDGEKGVGTRLMVGLEMLNTLALIEGRLADADAGVAQLGGVVGAAEYHFYALTAQLAAVRREQGRGAELMTLAPSEPGHGPILFPLAGALLRAEAGEAEAAARTVGLVMERLEHIGRDQAYTATMALLAECAALLGRLDWVPPIRERLAPLSGLVVVAGNGTIALGAVDRFLGMLLATEGRNREAVQRYRAALALEEKAGSPTWLVRTRLWLARALDPSDPERVGLLGAAGKEAERLGMVGQAELAARLSRADTSPA